MVAMLRSSMLLSITLHTLACDVSYDFGPHETALTTRMEVTLTWWAVTPQPPKPNVYMSTATGTACNSGYFGAQFHSDGNQSLLFSMWDAPHYTNNSRYVFQSLPGSKHCHRNALDAHGKSTGVQCAPHIGNESVKLDFGVPYTFTLAIVMTNSSGAMWAVTMEDPVKGANIEVGRIFFVDAPMGLDPKICRALGKSQRPPTIGLSSYTFQEYFAQPRYFLTSATWSDMKAYPPPTTANPNPMPLRPVGIVKECCDHGDYKHGDKINGSSATCLPPDCASPAIHFTMGPHLEISKEVLDANPGCLGPAK